MTGGMIKKLNTSNTPAIATELVTTMPKMTKNAKSHIDTAKALWCGGSVSLDAARSGRCMSQHTRPMTA